MNDDKAPKMNGFTVSFKICWEIIKGDFMKGEILIIRLLTKSLKGKTSQRLKTLAS